MVLCLAALTAACWPGTSAAAQTDVATATLDVAWEPATEIEVPLVIDRLTPETLLTVRATGFEPDTTGTVRQCVEAAGRPCGSAVPVRFDEHGAAIFQFLVSDRIGAAPGTGERCRLGEARCSIELRVGSRSRDIDTVFVDAAPPPGRLEVAPSRDLRSGDTVALTAGDFPPGSEMDVTVCAGSATSGPRCGAPAPVVTLAVGPDGAGETDMVLDVAAVGDERVECGRQTVCRIVVISSDPAVRALPVTLHFESGTGATYSLSRIATGLAVAAALLLVACWLVVTLDWRPPREAGAAPIDEAEFADLDAEAAAAEASDPTGGSARGATAEPVASARRARLR